MIINHLIFLIHSGIWEALKEKDPEFIRSQNCDLYVERELEVKQRWLSEVASVDEGALLLQLYGSKPLYVELREKLGEANACFVHADFPGEGQLREYYRRLTRCIHDHIESFGWTMNPATVTSEIWGCSFEGCAPGYAGAFAEMLGLKVPPRMRFEMTAYDSRFLYGTRRWETIPIRGSDIEAWLFECHDYSGAAIFQARLSAQWLDTRPIRLRLNPARLLVCDKRGHTVWPPTPWKKGDPEDLCDYQLTASDSSWVRSVRMSFDDFREVISGATVGEG